MKKRAIELVLDLVAGEGPENEKESERRERLEGNAEAELARELLELHDENEHQAEFILQLLQYFREG